MLNLSISQRHGDSSEELFDKKKWLEDLHPGFSSLNVQMGGSPKKKDDLISIFHIMIFCLKGTLPWYDPSMTIKDEIQSGRGRNPRLAENNRRGNGSGEQAKHQFAVRRQKAEHRKEAVDDADSAEATGNHC